ncbi:hypothetical protein DERF_009320 [Dermatophagoides farinae]|uniref:Uncharacterized protein n=1 Tax=Dermatophagoides farinae TaxID=6954 RepID=A0A922HX16_DERFA|nr:hypothetical protein DERF_009320 [Dermatophagoides farinae]
MSCNSNKLNKLPFQQQQKLKTGSSNRQNSRKTSYVKLISQLNEFSWQESRMAEWIITPAMFCLILLTLNVKSDYIAYTKLQNINFMASAKLNKLIQK